MFHSYYDMSAHKKQLDDTGLVKFEGLLNEQMLDKLEACYDRIMAGEYVSGNPPPRRTHPPQDSEKYLTRVSYPTVPDPALVGLLMEAGIGVLSSRLMNSDFAQAFFIHLVNKVPGEGLDYNISWHQDGQYGKHLFSGHWVTAHIALEDVNSDDAPILYVEDSHRLEPLNKREVSGFSFRKPLDELGQQFAQKAGIKWNVVEYLSKRGDVTFHDSRLIHATDNLLSGRTRKTFVLHLRFEHNKLLFSDPVHVTNEPPQPNFYVDIADLIMCPVLHGVATDLPERRLKAG